MSWHYLQEQAVAFSVEHYLAGLQSARAKSSHTPAILSNPDYQPLEFLRACGIKPYRIIAMVREMTVIPYWDTANNRLLYPVQQVINRANHHLLKTIRTRLGSKYAEHIAATRPYIEWQSPCGKRRAYYTPEITRL